MMHQVISTILSVRCRPIPTHSVLHSPSALYHQSEYQAFLPKSVKCTQLLTVTRLTTPCHSTHRAEMAPACTHRRAPGVCSQDSGHSERPGGGETHCWRTAGAGATRPALHVPRRRSTCGGQSILSEKAHTRPALVELLKGPGLAQTCNMQNRDALKREIHSNIVPWNEE